MRLPLLAICILLLPPLLSCSAGSRVTGAPHVARVTVAAPADSLSVGDTLQLAATVTDSNGSPVDGANVQWTTSDSSIAGVGPSGALTAWWPGAVTITATADGVSGTTQLAVDSGAVIAIQPDTVIGKVTFPQGDAPQGAQGSVVDSMTCRTSSAGVYHIHMHLSLFVNGQQIAIPLGIGMLDPVTTHGFAFQNRCHYALHTHDASGVLHDQSPTPGPHTLGEFFDVWGEPLSATNVAGFQGSVIAFVNGKRYTGDLRAITFVPHMQITLEVGAPVVQPPIYSFGDFY